MRFVGCFKSFVFVGLRYFAVHQAISLRRVIGHRPRCYTDQAVSLISKLMENNPETRWSAEQALDSDYFFESPIVKQAKDLSMKFAVTSVHEMGKTN